MSYFIRMMIAWHRFDLWYANYRLGRVSNEFYFGDISDLVNVTERRRRIQAEVLQLQDDLIGWESHQQLLQINP